MPNTFQITVDDPLPPKYSSLTDVLRKSCTSLTELKCVLGPPGQYPSWSGGYIPPCSVDMHISTNEWWKLFIQHNITTLKTLKLGWRMETRLPELLFHAHLFQNVTHVSACYMSDMPVWIRFLELLPHLTHFDGSVHQIRSKLKEDRDLWLTFLKHQSTLTDLKMTNPVQNLVAEDIITQVTTRNKTLEQLTSLPHEAVGLMTYFKQMRYLDEE